MHYSYKQVVLLILDGFGISTKSKGNAISAADPENLNYLLNNFTAVSLQASGPLVGFFFVASSSTSFMYFLPSFMSPTNDSTNAIPVSVRNMTGVV